MSDARLASIRLAAGLLVAAFASPAFAACNVSAQGVSFGNYDPLATSALDGVGNINVSCDATTSVTVSLSTGNGSFEQRRMVAGAAQLNYNLYKDASRLSVWSDGLGSATSNGTNTDLTVYGRIPALQNVPAAVFQDSITVTITY